MKIFRFFTFLLLSQWLCGCAEVQDIEFVRIRKLEFKEIREGKIIAQADAVFKNPNKRGGKVKKVDITIFAHDKESAKVLRSKSFKVPPDSEFTIPLDMEITFGEVAKDFLKNLFSRNREKDLPLQFRGNVWVSVYGITKKVPVEYEASLKFRF